MKKKIIISTVCIIVITGIVLVACGGDATPAATQEVVPVVESQGVIAEGRVVPAQYVSLSFSGGGRVGQIFVSEGEMVEAGQVLALLDNSVQLESGVASAELEVLNAQLALDLLIETADLVKAQALQEVALARDAVDNAQKRIITLKNGSLDTDVNAAKANIVLLKDRLEKALEEYEPYANKPEDNLTRAALQSKLAEAQALYDAAVRRLNNLEANASDIELAIAEANLAVSEAQLALAESGFNDVKDGPDADELAAAQARVKAANAALQSAQSALQNVKLIAPFAGRVVDISIKVGEQAVPSQGSIVIADFSLWYVDTDNLTEIEVPAVTVGQSVTIRPDALPDIELTGVVESISDLFEEKRGDVTYTVRIALEEPVENLRWGMTVVVEFKE
jgi:HlyD family secretion protein